VAVQGQAKVRTVVVDKPVSKKTVHLETEHQEVPNEKYLKAIVKQVNE
jgi:hypothetical protein